MTAANEGWRPLDICNDNSFSHFWKRYAKRTRIRSLCGRHTQKSSLPLWPDALTPKCQACERALAERQATTMKNLRRVVTGFRKGIVGDSGPDNMCYAVCAPLQSYLHLCGQPTELCEGYVDKRPVAHYWLRLPDGRIVDPTASQYSTLDKPMPEVYIGPQPIWYAAKTPPTSTTRLRNVAVTQTPIP